MVLVYRLTADQNLKKKTEIKNVRSPTTTEPTASGESNLIGTRTEETLTVTKKSQAVKEKWNFLLHKLLHCQIYEKDDIMSYQNCNVISRSMCWCESQAVIYLW